jgi:N4-(beta-N-acetylglucosaminyl)-L-asparaginase
MTNSESATVAHDTICMLAMDERSTLAAACSTNGAIHKVPGRVGDGAVPGGGAYIDAEVGGCAATGDGDVHLRYLPCMQVVTALQAGANPTRAAEDVVRTIAQRTRGKYNGAIVALGKDGRHGAAAFGFAAFSYAYVDGESKKVQIVRVEPLQVALENASDVYNTIPRP